MENSSQRRSRPLKPCSDLGVPELMAELATALSGKGPALGCGSLSTDHVPEQIALVTSTTGSTGEPKEVGLSATALLASARASISYLGASFGQSWSLLLPLTHIAGVNVLLRSLELGTMPIDLRESTKNKIVNNESYKRADFTAIVPTQLFRALNGDSKLLEHLKNCRAVLVGGAALAPAVAVRAKSAGINIVQTYGMSETCGGCVYNGEPLPGVEVKIIDGLVAIKGRTLATTYLNNESAWQESLKDGWFITSDHGILVDGKLQILGRSDDIIISGGENLSLNSIEEALKAHFPGIECAAFAVPHAEWGSALHIAIVESGFGADTLISEKEISSFLARTIGEAAKPKGFHKLPELPLIGIGKVDRNALVQLVQSAQLVGEAE